VTPLLSCWYADPAHRPSVGWCPPACNGPVTHSERAHNGDRLLYCETHAYWRHKTIRLPLVRRMRPGEQHASPSNAQQRQQTTTPAPTPKTKAEIR
jgi:hypothetical protein